MQRFVFLLLATLLAVNAAAAPRTGAPAPVLAATLLNGDHYTLTQSQGRVVLVTFWATWCSPCVQEMPELDRLYRTYHAQGLDILGVSVDDPADLAKVRDFTRSLHYPIAAQADVDAKGYGRIWAVPLLFVIDRHGVLREDGWPGLREKDYPKLEQMVKTLLAEKP
ncbi:MAG: TlpA disulfide reductase family protein [bacterium]|nr:TlpA disulfide reductase family protein [bacterium]